jgi:Ogr/Delta-like zinc finger
VKKDFMRSSKEVWLNELTENRCPHCEQPLAKWGNPELGSWGGEYQLVCFNDECSYFARGWNWMREKFNVNASYRYRFDPQTGERGPLPVWSKDALRNGIIATE